MNNRIFILLGALITGTIAAFMVQGYHHLTEGLPLGGLLTMILALVSVGILYAIVYASTGSLSDRVEGFSAGLFAGAVGGILVWAIGGAIFGPFTPVGILLSGLIGGVLFGAVAAPVQAEAH